MTKRRLKIGIDFDNTMIDYNDVFFELGRERGWIPEELLHSKESVKKFLVETDGDDLRWQRLQADAYGQGILRARVFSGFMEFLSQVSQSGHDVIVISHKTETSNLDRVTPLREWARRWLEQSGIAHKVSKVYFESTLEDKIGRIIQAGCHVFVDDLMHVLCQPSFPPEVKKIWFANSGETDERTESFSIVRTEKWTEIAQEIGKYA